MPPAILAMLLPVAEKLLFRVARAYVAKQFPQHPEILDALDSVAKDLGIS